MNDGGWTLGHRPALDDLRGIAILLVLACHAHVPGLATLGGPVGVGLFFTLSGFLITGLLLDEQHRTGRISFRRFYERRARRLLPALFALVTVVAALRVILGPWWLDWGTIPVVLLYVGNWLPINGTELKALGATWTLSVEEQFYILWPLLIALLARRRRVVAVSAALAAVSVLIRLKLLADGQVGLRVPLGSDTVAVALLLGAVTVGLRLAGGPGRCRPWLAGVGLAGIAASLLIGSAWYLVVGPPLRCRVRMHHLMGMQRYRPGGIPRDPLAAVVRLPLVRHLPLARPNPVGLGHSVCAAVAGTRRRRRARVTAAR